MSAEGNTVWKQIHYGEAPIVDLHVHPSLKAFLLKRMFTTRFGALTLGDSRTVAWM